MELNKIIRRVLKEAVGVPDGVVETAEKVYNQVMKHIKSIGSIGEDEEISLGLNGDYKISDYEFKKIDLDLEIFRTPKVDVGTIAGMSFRFASQLNNKTLKLVHTPTENKIELTISIAIPEDGDLNSVIQELERNRQLSISSLSHELMHAYDKFKNPESHPTQRADYDTYKSVKFGIDPIDEFLHNLYFTHSIENIVRPSEVAADLKVGNIDKKGFLEFLKNNRVYKQLKEIYNFSYEGFKNELLDHVDLIRTRLEQSGLEDIPEDDYELVNTVLELLMINIINGKAKSLKNDLTTDIFEELLGFSGKKEEVFTKYLKKIQKYENYDDFFKNEEKMFKQVSSNLIKKIHKLYSILNDGSDTTNESIIDWDLYHEIKETPIVIETKINYSPEERKLRLIQRFLDDTVKPKNDLICDIKVFRFTGKREYAIKVWLKDEVKGDDSKSSDIVNQIWDEIFDMFEIPTTIYRNFVEC